MHFTQEKTILVFFFLQVRVNNTNGKCSYYLQKYSRMFTLFKKTCLKGIIIYNGHSLMETEKLRTDALRCHMPTKSTFVTVNL